MKPLEALGSQSPLPKLLMSGTPADVEAALERAAGEGTDAAHAASLKFARAAWALREGKLELARVGFEDGARAFEALGDRESAELSKIEGAISLARRGRREAALEAEAIVAPLEDGGATPEVRARATLARGTAQRVLGDASRAQASFARALELAREQPEVRTMALNSMGTLCVSLGAFGAADTLCEHAAELCRLKKDVVGEAIAMGQLGASALGRSDLDKARKYLSRQEWLCTQIGDTFGRTRALVWLAEVALEAGRADDAAELARRAIESANAVSPPLSTFAAYADRALGRARIQLGEAAGRDDIMRAHATFAAQRLPLGEALAARDCALAAAPIDRPGALAALGALAGLGLPERVAEALPALGADAALELALAAPNARRLEPLEARLIYERPRALAGVSEARSAARKNVSRLAVLALSDPGLWVAALATQASVFGESLVDDTQIACAHAGGVPGLHLLVWSGDRAPDAVGADLAAVMRRAGSPVTIALSHAPAARVITPGFGGGLPPRLEGLDALALCRSASDLSPGTFTLAGAPAGAEPLVTALEQAGLSRDRGA